MIGARIVAAVTLALVGCLDKAANDCGGGIICPADKVCLVGGGCALPEQLAACSGMLDGAACTFAGSVGKCMAGVCIGSQCGNGTIDPGELCDDGNASSGDGCRADCLKVEMCGDGIVDVGEACDDGNGNPADGCDDCKLTTWTASAVIGGHANAASVGIAPLSVTVDRFGTVYVAEYSRIRRIDAGIVTTVAGNGTPGFSGDGGAATSAQLQANSVAVDGLGNLYIADQYNHRVRHVDISGVITTIAGTGTPGSNGDGGAATSAQLDYPTSVAVDGFGNVYIADSANNRVRRIDVATGIIEPFAGNGTQGDGGDGLAATDAELFHPNALAFDGVGNLYIADSAMIRWVDASGIIHAAAGTGVYGYSGDGVAATSAELADPSEIAFDNLGNLYIADQGNTRIRRVDTDHIITTVAGNGTSGYSGDGGAATDAKLYQPYGVAVDGLGDVYIADTSNYRVRRVHAGMIATFAGSGTVGYIGDGAAATSALLYSPEGVATDGDGNLYVADSAHYRVRRVDALGVMTTVAGDGTVGSGGDNGPATSAQLKHPKGLAVDSAGRVYIADLQDSRIRRVDASGIITTVAGTGVYGFGGDGGLAIDAQLARPEGIAVDGAGNLYIADTENSRIRRVDATTHVITTVAGTSTCPEQACPGFSGDGGLAADAQLDGPINVALDGIGDLYIADFNNQRIRRIDATTTNITTVAGTGVSGYDGDGVQATSAQLASPAGVAFDGMGNLYIADVGNARVRRVDTTGEITTVAGSGIYGYDGDGGAATSARMSPFAVALDSVGNIYTADAYGNRVRRIRNGVITSVAGLVDPQEMGPFVQAHLADPRAIIVAAPFTLFAGGSSGTVQAVPTGSAWLEVVAGRYPQPSATGTLARYRGPQFGTISGVAYDGAGGIVYLTESSATDLEVGNRLLAVTVVDPTDATTWTVAPLAGDGTLGFADGSAATARFSDPTGLYFDAVTRVLYVADTGNHVIRAIDLASGIANAQVHTVAGTPATRGYFGDSGDATSALLFDPQAITKCANGDLFIADTGNNRVRRVEAGTNMISTVIGDGSVSSSGEGTPAKDFPINAPLGLACDASGNLFVTSTTAVRLVTADAHGVVDGNGQAETIDGKPPRSLPLENITRCLTGLAVVDATTVQVVDSCTGLLVELQRMAP